MAFIRWQDTPRLGIPTSSSFSSRSRGEQQREQQQQQQASGSATALGVPIRLKEWIKGYPAMLSFLHEQQQSSSTSSSQHPSNHHPHNNNMPHLTSSASKNAIIKNPRKGAKTVTLTSVRRNVRMYSPDLVKSAATWAHRGGSNTRSFSSSTSNSVSSSAVTAAQHHPGVMNGLANSKEWDRIAPATLKLPPRYSETFKKRMNMLAGVNPDMAPGMVGYSLSAGSLGGAGGMGSSHNNTGGGGGTLPPTLSIGTISTSTSTSGGTDKDYFGLGLGNKREGEDRFRSLTDLKWGEFESMGFASTGENEKKLQFDLTEGAREVSYLTFFSSSQNSKKVKTYF